MGRPRWEVAGYEIGRRIYHMTWDFQDAVPSFEREDKQQHDKFRKTKRNGVNHAGGRQWGQQNRKETQKNTKRVGRK
jgi:hypothetical protein